MNEKILLEMRQLCAQFRRQMIEMLYNAQSGHPGGSLSCMEILTVLYYHQMRIRPDDPHWPERDRMILSKGHAAPALYTVLANRGYFPLSLLSTFRRPGSLLQGHPNATLTPGVDASAGPLGLGLAFAVGNCLAAQINGSDYMNYVLLGDGELQEGIIWEAAMAAAKYRCDRTVAIVDWNGVQLDGSNDEIMPLGDLRAKFSAFGWRVLECDGHSVEELSACLQEASQRRGQPSLILAHTVKGKGVSFMENKSSWHGKVISPEEYKLAMAELKEAPL